MIRMIRPAALILSTLVLLAGCAEKPDPGSPVDLRQQTFKKMVKVFEVNNGMARERLPWNDKQFLDAAFELKRISDEPWAHFANPEPRKGSHASDAIWQKPSEFKVAQQRFAQSVDGLLLAANQHDPKQAMPAVEAVEQACAACHRTFRNK
ncbi:cytochrome c [Burkholderiaceae bacterium DAT-1]|nr:cytochrome c [Burkholderiaceae bacterium DAT-1]